MSKEYIEREPLQKLFNEVSTSFCMETFSENSGRWKFCPKCGEECWRMNNGRDN